MTPLLVGIRFVNKNKIPIAVWPPFWITCKKMEKKAEICYSCLLKIPSQEKDVIIDVIGLKVWRPYWITIAIAENVLN